MASPLSLFPHLDPRVAEILLYALEGQELTTQDAEYLLSVTGSDTFAITAAADIIRQYQAGDKVSFIINRNINFTNICENSCRFCAFSVSSESAEGYFLSNQDIKKRVLEAVKLGASEVCVQGGIHPKIDLNTYLGILETVRKTDHSIHIHAFSPEEIRHAHRQSGESIESVLRAMREAGLGSMPGTAAEILHDRVRRILCPKKLPTQDWIDIIRSAHRQGIPTTGTILFGTGIETIFEQAQHLEILRSIQKETGSFTEFVPLPYVGLFTPLSRNQPHSGPSGIDAMRFYAVSRLYLGRDFRNIQASWVKLGPLLAQVMLCAGCNDIGGTLLEESITRAAGGKYGEKMSVEKLVSMIHQIGRPHRQRNTLYSTVKHSALEK